MKFLVDNQLPVALARWIAAQGMDVVHVQTMGWAEKDDFYLWQLATREGWIAVSKDEDFFYLSGRPGDRGRLLWCRLGNFRKHELLRRFEEAWPSIYQAFDEGQRVSSGPLRRFYGWTTKEKLRRMLPRSRDRGFENFSADLPRDGCVINP